LAPFFFPGPTFLEAPLATVGCISSPFSPATFSHRLPCSPQALITQTVAAGAMPFTGSEASGQRQRRNGVVLFRASRVACARVGWMRPRPGEPRRATPEGGDAAY
jgi:hypothetical protein